MRNIFLIASFILFSVNTLLAQAPESFNFQGVARDNAGNALANTNIALRATILSGSATGNVEYQETQAITTNGYGLFSIAIGSGSVQAGTFAYVPWSHLSNFLKIEIDPTGGANYTLTSTTQILSVPYSLYAKNGYLNVPSDSYSAADLDNSAIGLGGNFFGKNGGEDYIRSFWGFTIDRNNGNQGYGSSSYNAGILPDGGSFAVRYRTSPTVFRTDFIVRGTGKVGIGLTDPKSTLHVNGDVQLEQANGIILKSSVGSCFKVTVDNAGNLTTTPITCP